MNTKILWIDIAKGIGIMLVVIGHCLIAHKTCWAIIKYIYWFHMPLFFIISGMLHKQDKPFGRFVAAKARHLMIPYCCILFLFYLKSQFVDGIHIPYIHYLIGGPYKHDVWWFVVCLFLTQVVAYSILQSRYKRYILYGVFAAYILIMVAAIEDTVFYYTVEVVSFKLPLELDLVPIALLFYLMGYCFRDAFLQNKCSPPLIAVTSLLLVCGIMAVDYLGGFTLPAINIEGRKFGWPVVNLLIPLPYFVLVRNISIVLSANRVLGCIVGSIGTASLMILFLDKRLPGLFLKSASIIIPLPENNFLLQIVLGIALPWLAYQIFLKFSLTRKCFNGIWR